jgi:hypothetical protein
MKAQQKAALCLKGLGNPRKKQLDPLLSSRGGNSQ